jgi:hypothetical protein
LAESLTGNSRLGRLANLGRRVVQPTLSQAGKKIATAREFDPVLGRGSLLPAASDRQIDRAKPMTDRAHF